MLNLAWRDWVGILGLLLGAWCWIMEEICSGSEKFMKALSGELGQVRVKFWYDLWLDGGMLKTQFSKIFLLLDIMMPRSQSPLRFGREWFMDCGGLKEP